MPSADLLRYCPTCAAHRAVRDERCERCDSPLPTLDAPPDASRGLMSRLGRATRGGVLAGALLGLAAGGVSGCSDDGGNKVDTKVVRDDGAGPDGTRADGKADGPAGDTAVTDTGKDAARDAAADTGTDAADAAIADAGHDIPVLPPYGISPVDLADLV